MKNKAIFKSVFVILALAFIICCLSVSAFAAVEDINEVQGAGTDSGIREDIPQNGAQTDEVGTTDSGDTDNISNDTDGACAPTYAELIFDTVTSYLGEILSTLSFVASLVLLFLYKRGILPAITSFTSLSRSEIKSVREAAAEQNIRLDAFSSHIESAMASLGADIEGMEKYLSTLSEKLGAVMAEGQDIKGTKDALISEIELLYEVFMASSLPQYQKERIGERVCEMKRLLGASENAGE